MLTATCNMDKVQLQRSEFHLEPASKQSKYLYDIYLMLYVQTWNPDDGRKVRPKRVEWYSINSEKLCI
jgi:hypothetical protein